uniref:cysteine-rich venom protein-like n=1 Tax=Monopterus albus TaxID=43700 RepID=UPI0009B30504|nr:cysteine-rich venom protein-like [Monopterus albus]
MREAAELMLFTLICKTLTYIFFSHLCKLNVKEESGLIPSVVQEIEKLHNDLRKTVQPTAKKKLKMKWDAEVAAKAQEWADTCSMEHSPQSSRMIGTVSCGENLFMSNSKVTWRNVILFWYREGPSRIPGLVIGKADGDLSQLVWYMSTKIGCGMSYCPNAEYKYFYVCLYWQIYPLSLL